MCLQGLFGTAHLWAVTGRSLHDDGGSGQNDGRKTVRALQQIHRCY